MRQPVRLTRPSSGIFCVLFSFFLGLSTLLGVDLKNPPSDNIYDPAGLLDDNFYSAIKRRIVHEKRNRQFEIFLILYDEEPTQGDAVLARQAGESWAEGEYWTVIYQVRADGEIGCVAGGAKMNQLSENVIARNIRGALGASSLVETHQGQIEALVTNLADGFSYVYVIANENFNKAVEGAKQDHARREQRKKKIKLVLAALTVLIFGLVGVGYALWRKYFRKMKPVMLPLTTPRKRLAAPYSGGGDVLLKYKRD